MYFRNAAGVVYVKNGSLHVELEMYSITITPKLEENIELFLKNEFDVYVEILKEAVLI